MLAAACPRESGGRHDVTPAQAGVQSTTCLVTLVNATANCFSNGNTIREDRMIVEEKLTTLGLSLPDLDAIYRTNRSGARFLSHIAVQNLLYLVAGARFRHATTTLLEITGCEFC